MNRMFRQIHALLPAGGYWIGVCILLPGIITASVPAVRFASLIGVILTAILAYGLTRRMKWAFLCNACLLFLSLVEFGIRGRADASVAAEVFVLLFYREYYEAKKQP